MSKFIDAVKAGVQAMHEDLGPKRYAAAGRVIQCDHCREERFEARELLLDTRWASAAGLDWLNRGAVALTCAACSRMQWFAARPQPVEG